MQSIQVIAYFDSHGQIRPRSFVYQGRTIPVDSIGRQWLARDGVHILVLAPNHQHYHLIFQPDSGEWYLLQIGQAPTINHA
jgi:hypothetical protein